MLCALARRRVLPAPAVPRIRDATIDQLSNNFGASVVGCLRCPRDAAAFSCCCSMALRYLTPTGPQQVLLMCSPSSCQMRPQCHQEGR